MKINVNDKRRELAKRSDKFIITGTILKIILPGTGIGSAFCAYGWTCAIADAANNPDDYKVMINNNPAYKDFIEPNDTVNVGIDDLSDYINKMKKILEDKTNEGESQ